MNQPWPFPLSEDFDPKSTFVGTDVVDPEPAFDRSKVCQARKILAASIESDRLDLLHRASYQGVQIVHVFDSDYPKGGLTVAFRKCQPNQRSTNMVEVAVATCSRADNFSRKIGTQIALYNFFAGETIDLPLSTGHADEDLNGIVKVKFSELYNI